MATGIRDKVAILGMGCSKFGERWDKEADDLMVEAFEEAIADAGIEKNQIEAAWLATAIEEQHVGKSGVPLAVALRLPYIPVTDKTAHFVSYFLLAAGISIAMMLQHRRNIPVTVLAIALAYGAIDEWTQIPVHRSCELADWYADAAGASTAVVLTSILFSRRFG